MKSGYEVGPGDLLEIRVWNQPELSGEIRVFEDGTIILPIIGKVKVEGKTAEEISEMLSQKLSKYISETVKLLNKQNLEDIILGKISFIKFGK